MRLDPNSAFSFQGLRAAYTGLNRFAEAKALGQKQVELKLDGTGDHGSLYVLAFIAGDAAGMHQQVEWAKGRQDEFLLSEAQAEAAEYSGEWRQGENSYQRALESVQRGKFEESAAEAIANQALRDAMVGNTPKARDLAAAAVARKRTDTVLYPAALALAMVGDASRAAAMADELQRQLASDTAVNEVFVPAIRAEIEINHGDARKAVELLQRAAPYELGFIAGLVPPYVRGQAYMRQGKGPEAAAEFQKILDHRGAAPLSMAHALARLQLGRARVLTGENAGARAAYQDFFALWKDADPDIPILQQAKAEYAKLQ